MLREVSKMTREEVLKYFGTFYRMYKETGIHQSNQQAWKARGYVPVAMQIRLEHMTKGALKADKFDPKAHECKTM